MPRPSLNSDCCERCARILNRVVIGRESRAVASRNRSIDPEFNIFFVASAPVVGRFVDRDFFHFTPLRYATSLAIDLNQFSFHEFRVPSPPSCCLNNKEIPSTARKAVTPRVSIGYEIRSNYFERGKLRDCQSSHDFDGKKGERIGFLSFSLLLTNPMLRQTRDS